MSKSTYKESKLSDEEYFALEDNLGSTDVKNLYQSIDAFVCAREDRVEDRAGMEMGRALHAAILQPEVYDETYVENPFKDKRTKKYKEWKESLTEDAVVLNTKEVEKLNNMISNVRLNSTFKEMYKTDVEHSTEYAVWDLIHPSYSDEEFQLKIKAKFDYVNFEDNYIVDVKKINRMEKLKDVERAIVNYKYYVQSIYYKMAYVLAFGKVPDFYFMFVEDEAPWGVRWVKTSVPYYDEKGETIIKRAFEKYIAWKKGNADYTGYSPEIKVVEPPIYL